MRRGRLVQTRLVGVLAAAAAILATAFTFVQPSLPWNRAMHLQVQAAAFGEVNPGAWVELSGARVGSVDRVDDQQGHALLHLTIDLRSAGQLHRNATAEIRPHGLLGPKYVYLNGGTTGMLGDGATIPLSRTTESTDFDQVLNALQPDVRQNLKVIFVELGKASNGRGAQMNAGFQALGQSAPDISTTTSVLHQRDDDLAALIVASEKLDRDLQYAPIDRNIADTDQMLSGLVQVDAQLGDGIDQTAAVMQRLDVALQGNSANLAQVLKGAPATVSRLRAMAAELDAIVTGVNPALPSLMEALVETKSAFQGQDANGHFVRVQIVGSAHPTGSPVIKGSPPGSTSEAPLTDQDLVALFMGG
jgi:phospholipid/cholesterol/gamma-HCH transport system substrate-binding protein